MKFAASLVLAGVSLSLFATGCSGGDAAPAEADDDVASGNGPSLCAAVRGNGELIGAHFQSLAHVVETYGVVDGIAGGSSGSITSFLYESILLSPSVSTCNGKVCDSTQKSARVALALKSIMGYGEVVASSNEALAVQDAVAIAMKVKTEAEAQGALTAVSQANVQELAQKLKAVLSIQELKDIVNPELFAMLEDTAHLAFNVGEIQTSIKTLGAFSVDQNRLFFRPGLLNWKSLANLFGRVGDFYAGYGPADAVGFSAWLDACADGTTGKVWDEAAGVTTKGGTCGGDFGKLVVSYREKARAEGAAPRRLGEKVGGPALHKLISTSVLTGAAASQYEASRAEYLAGKYPTGAIASFTPSFEDVKFGYWGGADDLARLAQNTQGFGDEKTRKMTSLGSDATWGDILSASPAEPGLSRLVKLADGRYSAGGWSDLAPVLALKNIGCKRVVYVQRQGDESVFAAQIAVQLGMGEAKWKALYDLSTQDSGYAVSVAKADAVWCTNWNAFTATQQVDLAKDAYNAPFELRGIARRKQVRAYARSSTTPLGIAGCSAGVPGTKTWQDVAGK